MTPCTLQHCLSWALAIATIACAMGVVGFESTKRSATCLLGTGAFAGMLLLAEGAGEAGASIFWLVASTSMLLLVTGLLINLRHDEVGRRRFSIRRTIAGVVMAYFSAAIGGMLFGDPKIVATLTTPPAAPLPAIAQSLTQTGVVSLVLIALCLLALIPAVLLLARREA